MHLGLACNTFELYIKKIYIQPKFAPLSKTGCLIFSSVERILFWIKKLSKGTLFSGMKQERMAEREESSSISA